MYLYPNKIYKTCKIFSKILYLQNFYLIDEETKTDRADKQIGQQLFCVKYFFERKLIEQLFLKIAIFIFIFLKNINIV